MVWTASHRLESKELAMADSPRPLPTPDGSEFWSLVAASYGRRRDYENRLVDLLGLFDFCRPPL